MIWQTSRRNLLRAGVALAGAGVLQACGNGSASKPPIAASATVPTQTVTPKLRRTVSSGNNVLRIIASSGFAADQSRIQMGINRLQYAGFNVSNQQAAYRRYQRFAGNDAERVADFQEVASGRVATPKVLMGLRGGYGAQRLLPHIDFASLGSRMREQGTLFFGFSDVCALQLALLAKSNMCSFAGPMVYSEFGKAMPSSYTMDSFINCTTNQQITIHVSEVQRSAVPNIEGTLWGGNLSVLVALAGSPYFPNVNGGILFLEDVGEQPYRIERMLQTLLLAGVLQKQQAIILGNFRMGTIRDVYDSSYDFFTVTNLISRAARVPVLTGFPFGHITNKASFPLGALAKVRGNSNGGYSVTFSDYPTLNRAQFSLDTLLPQIPVNNVVEESSDLE